MVKMDDGKMKNGGVMKDSSSPAAANASGIPDALGSGFSLKPARKKLFRKKAKIGVFRAPQCDSSLVESGVVRASSAQAPLAAPCRRSPRMGACETRRPKMEELKGRIHDL